jgi:hypothetical protein
MDIKRDSDRDNEKRVRGRVGGRPVENVFASMKTCTELQVYTPLVKQSNWHGKHGHLYTRTRTCTHAVQLHALLVTHN